LVEKTDKTDSIHSIFEEQSMRKSYSNQLRLDSLPIEQVTLNLESRDHIVPILLTPLFQDTH
ncbi:MAG: hypothetical protein P8M30_07885, partial [Planctomycetaceae bacterium]|nr:hypothetical protein [Planctomycetaceae bacterium]